MHIVFTRSNESTPPIELPGDHDGNAVPYVFVGDEALPMKTYLLRP